MAGKVKKTGHHVFGKKSYPDKVTAVANAIRIKKETNGRLILRWCVCECGMYHLTKHGPKGNLS